MSLTDPEFIQRLEGLALLAKKVLGGKLQANRRTRRKGTGVSFADYAPYFPGDDHRAVDWRVYARTEQLVIKLFELEEDMTLVLLLDRSASMEAKLPYAKELAAALGYLALAGFDRVAVYGIGERLTPVLEATHGKAKVVPLLAALDGVEAIDRGSDFNGACAALAARHRRRLMVVPVSDFFFPGGCERGLSLLRHGGHEVFCAQVQSPGDRAVDHRGDAELVCVETGRAKKVTVGPAEAAAYAAAVTRLNDELETACRRKGIGHLSVLDTVPFDDVVQRVLRRGGLVG